MTKMFFVLLLLQAFQAYNAVNFDPTEHENWHLLDHGSDCGESPGQDRIIGGKDATLGQYPWIAALHYKSNSQELKMNYLCGGAIISAWYVVTAAHCLPGINDLTIDMVRLGEYNLNTDPDCVGEVCAPPVQDIKVAEVIIHKNYTIPTPFENDICLLRLEKPIKFNEYVSPICMVHGSLMNETHVGEIMEVAGWGLTNMTTHTRGTTLKTLNVPVWNDTMCQSIFEDEVVIGKKQFCAGGVLGKDSCSGDSGGPLMNVASVDVRPPRYYLFGVVSFGIEDCAQYEFPGVYTKMSHFMEWILDTIVENGDNGW